jgi:hypothetical protein
MDDKKYDLLYARVTGELKTDLEAIGCKVDDASDDIHQDRSSVYYDNYDEYKAVLKKHQVIGASLTWLNDSRIGIND